MGFVEGAGHISVELVCPTSFSLTEDNIGYSKIKFPNIKTGGEKKD
jgi:hypothetical protein